MLNFLFCFDDGYNVQAQCAIFSLLENVSEKINIFLVHKTKESHNFIENKIVLHPNLNSIVVKKFKNSKTTFPNLKGAHVSQATYYRIYLEEYIDTDIDFLIYLDSDIICISDPIKIIKNEIAQLTKAKATISANLEHNLTGSKERLDLDTDKYFNAGVLIIDYKKWTKHSTSDNLLKLMLGNKKELKYWDQDLLNIFFNGNFSEMSKSLNYRLEIEAFEKTEVNEIKKIENSDIVFIHYLGKFKPWNVKGVINKKCNFYLNTYRNLFSKDYHVSYNYKLNAFKDLVKGWRTFSIFETDKPLLLTYNVLISLLKVNKKYD